VVEVAVDQTIEEMAEVEPAGEAGRVGIAYDGACSADAQATGRSSIGSPGTSRRLSYSPGAGSRTSCLCAANLSPKGGGGRLIITQGEEAP
jgi:hypothetical protein